MISKALVPLNRITAIAPTPAGVANATIVSSHPDSLLIICKYTKRITAYFRAAAHNIYF